MTLSAGFNSLIIGRVEPAATPFAAVVILTTLAVPYLIPAMPAAMAGASSEFLAQLADRISTYLCSVDP